MDGPQIAEAITEHSICHPGLPLPHGDSHDGSPALDFFQRAKSVEDRFSFNLSSPVHKSPARWNKQN